MNPLIAPHYQSQDIPQWVDSLGTAQTLVEIPMLLVGGTADPTSSTSVQLSRTATAVAYAALAAGGILLAYLMWSGIGYKGGK
jgi:hypothetical protein